VRILFLSLYLVLIRRPRTERTYVKGLQELVDIYIKPACAPVNVLTGGSKESVVPAVERKIVFSGLEALFSFHKESFLPALEKAAAPAMQPSEVAADADKDGAMSMNAARTVGNCFISHAAFMRMYSTYIKWVLYLMPFSGIG